MKRAAIGILAAGLAVCFCFRVPVSAGIRYFERVDMIPVKMMDETESRKLRESGASEADILGYFLRKYFYAVPVWSGEIPEYKPGAVRVTEDDSGSRVVLDEPVTGFSVLLLYKTDGGNKMIIRKEIRRLSDIVDTVDYEYRDGRLSAARSGIYGRVKVPSGRGE